MARTAAQRKAQRAYNFRRKLKHSPRTDDLQRAFAQAMRETWQEFFTNEAAMKLIGDVLAGAKARLLARGFDAELSERRLAVLLRSTDRAIRPGGKVLVRDDTAPRGVRVLNAKRGGER